MTIVQTNQDKYDADGVDGADCTMPRNVVSRTTEKQHHNGSYSQFVWQSELARKRTTPKSLLSKWLPPRTTPQQHLPTPKKSRRISPRIIMMMRLLYSRYLLSPLSCCCCSSLLSVTRCRSLLLVVTHCHSLSLIVAHCHSLLLIGILCTLAPCAFLHPSVVNVLHVPRSKFISSKYRSSKI